MSAQMRSRSRSWSIWSGYSSLVHTGAIATTAARNIRQTASVWPISRSRPSSPSSPSTGSNANSRTRLRLKIWRLPCIEREERLRGLVTHRERQRARRDQSGELSPTERFAHRVHRRGHRVVGLDSISFPLRVACPNNPQWGRMRAYSKADTTKRVRGEGLQQETPT